MLLEANDSILRERVGRRRRAQCYKFKRAIVLAHLVTRFYRCPFVRAYLARSSGSRVSMYGLAIAVRWPPC